MLKNPECANCFEEIPWSPVYSDGEPYCCDGCVMGGPCVCTYEGPPPRLNIEDILATQGQSAATECANCFEEFHRPPVSYKGRMYCCQGCVRGGPCICTYEPSKSTPESEEDSATGSQTFPPSEQTSRAPYVEPEAPRRANRLWGTTEQAAEASAAETQAPRKMNRLWGTSDQDSETTPEEGASTRANRFWGGREPGRSEVSATAGDKPPYADQKEGKGHDQVSLTPWTSSLEPEPDFDDPRIYTKFQLSVSPLIEMVDVSLFTTELQRIPAVEGANLTHFEGDRATFEIETMIVKDVIKGIMNVDRFRVQSLRMTPDGLDLLLVSSGTDAGEEQPKDMVITLSSQESNAEEPDTHPVPRQRLVEHEAAARFGDESELHAFKFQMGVDVFFNGRHQVEIGGVRGPVHMHSWRVQAILEGESVDEAGSVIGTEEVRETISRFVTPFNEKLLNKTPPFDEIMPTANNMARVIYDHVAGALGGQGVRIKSVRLWESPTSYVEYSGEGGGAV